MVHVEFSVRGGRKLVILNALDRAPAEGKTAEGALRPLRLLA